MKEKIKDNIIGWLYSILLAFLIVFCMKTFIGMPTTVRGISMENTLLPGEKLFMGTFIRISKKVPDRGDIITFEAPSEDLAQSVNLKYPVAKYDKDTSSLMDKILYATLGISKRSYIKRVIGVSGDHIKIENGNVYLNGNLLEEEYLEEGTKTEMVFDGFYDNVIVPDGYVYVLGDNRSASIDSRKFGCIPIKRIEGKALFRWWPLNKFGKV